MIDSKDQFDLCVIGGGPAGYAAAMRAVDLHKRVLLIEKDRIGGAGIYNGALSSKTLWELSQKVVEVNEVISTRLQDKVELSWKEIKSTLDRAVFDRKYQYACHIKLLENEVEHDLFQYERGKGEMLDANTIRIVREGFERTVHAENIIIATGSRPRQLPEIIANEETILTSDGIDKLKDLPESIVIVGAGVIGCEFATIFANFGKTKVHLIDRADHILPFEDNDISELISKNFEQKGIRVHRQAKLVRLEMKDGKVEYEISKPNGPNETIQVEKALLSIGRVPNVEGIGLENAGVKLNERGAIHEVDTRTNVPNIYAVGDVSGRIMLVNMGEVEARHAVERMFQDYTRPIKYDNVSTIMFLMPEVAGVGMNEQQAQEKGIAHKVAKIDYSCIARAIAMRRTQGFFKIIVSDDEEMHILGMRAVGEHASSAIQAVALMIHSGIPAPAIAELVHPHPSIIEGIQECVRMLLDRSIFKSAVFKDKLFCYRWENGVETPLQVM